MATDLLQPDTAGYEAALDALQTEEAPAAHRWSAVYRRGLPSLVAVIVLVVAWQGFVASGSQPSYTVPGPVDVWQTAARLWQRGDLSAAVLTSISRGVIGFVVAVAVGTPIGVLIGRFRLLRTAVGPLVSGLQVLPSVAWVPAAIIWFGLSEATVYFVILMGAVPSVVNGLISGIDQVPPSYLRVGRVLGAGRLSMIRRVVLPAAVPGYLAGLKQGWAFSWRSLMAAEIIAVGGRMGFGLGSLLNQGRELSDMSAVLVAIIAILAVGIVVELAVFAPLERSVLRRRGLATGTGGPR